MTKFFGENLKNLRHLFGYSQAALAAQTGIIERDIWQFENGYKEPTFAQINTLKVVFHVRAKYFYQKDLLHDQPNNINLSYMSIKG